MKANRDPELLVKDQEGAMTRSRGLRPRSAGSPRSNGHIVVKLPSEIDITNSSQVQDLLVQALADGADVIIADATATTFCDCAGAAVLMNARHRAAGGGKQLRIAAGPALLRLLSLTGPGHGLDVHPSLAAALARLAAIE
jgi:anti-sigma B factor antagonist